MREMREMRGSSRGKVLGWYMEVRLFFCLGLAMA